jgi:hypothetical protein
LVEAAALLPPRLRWYLTFNTYFTELPAGLSCAWRCVVADSTAAKDAHRYATTGLVIDLTRAMGTTPERSAAKAAREGTMLVVPGPANSAKLAGLVSPGIGRESPFAEYRERPD